MRARFFRWLLKHLEHHTPPFVRRLALQILMNATARAFRMHGKRLWTLPWRDGLRLYAEYTRARPNVDPEALYSVSYTLGQRLRHITGLTDPRDLRRLVFWLYSGIGISMGGKLPGEVSVSGCFFSDYYTPAQCAMMSNMDSGIVGGIMGGGKLIFTQRITEGAPCCKARLTSEANGYE